MIKRNAAKAPNRPVVTKLQIIHLVAYLIANTVPEGDEDVSAMEYMGYLDSATKVKSLQEAVEIIKDATGHAIEDLLSEYLPK